MYSDRLTSTTTEFKAWQDYVAAGPFTCLFTAVVCLTLPAARLAPATGDDSLEVVTHETEPSFWMRARRDLVLVPATVLDSSGRAISGLRKDDFRLHDESKEQAIIHFSVMGQPAAGSAFELPSTPAGPGEGPRPALGSPTTLQRYVALYFDDIHVQPAETSRLRSTA